MAFRILSDEEKQLLNASEREAYEKLYSEYLERMHFVDRLEQLRNVKMPAVALHTKGIHTITPNPSAVSAKIEDFTVDTTSLGATLSKAVGQAKIQADKTTSIKMREYKVSLPPVSVPVQNKVNVKQTDDFKVELPNNVAVVSPLDVSVKFGNHKTVLPDISQYSTPLLPDFISPKAKVTSTAVVVPQSADIKPIDTQESFNVTLPNVECNSTPTTKFSFETFNATIPAVTISKPIEVNGDIPIAKVQKSVIPEISSPVVNFAQPSIKTATVDVHGYFAHIEDIKHKGISQITSQPYKASSLSAIPIPTMPTIPKPIRAEISPISVPKAVVPPDESIELTNEQTISELPKISMPKPAKAIEINTTEVEEPKCIRVSAPAVGDYVAPKYQVQNTNIPIVKTPKIDEVKALAAILSS